MQRRIWASYARAGFSRFAFAKTLGVAYSTVDAWDTEQAMPRVEQLIEICELLQQPIAGICFGHAGQPDGLAESEIGDVAIKTLLTEVRASQEARAALGRHLAEDGRFQAITRSYVLEFLRAFDASGKALEDASKNAAKAALVGQALLGAATSGGAPITAGLVRSLIDRQHVLPMPSSTEEVPSKPRSPRPAKHRVATKRRRR